MTISAHIPYNIKFHLAWATRYREPILTGYVGIRLRELIREVCRAYEIEILEGHIDRDFVRIFVSAPPELSPDRIMRRIKGEISGYKAMKLPGDYILNGMLYI